MRIDFLLYYASSLHNMSLHRTTYRGAFGMNTAFYRGHSSMWKCPLSNRLPVTTALSAKMIDERLQFELVYDSHTIGDIREAFCGEKAVNTWFGEFQISENINSNEMIGQFINFCKKWHQRLENGEEPSANEFDSYKNIIDSNSWCIKSSDGTAITIKCPVFYDHVITWTPKE